MQNYNCRKDKISVFEILQQGFSLYINNFKVLIGISVLYFLISFIAKTFEYYKNFIGSLWHMGGYIIIQLILIIPYIYFTTILAISMISVISNKYNHRNMSLREAYAFSKTKFWRYFGASIGFGLIIMVPFIIEIVILMTVKEALLKYSLLIVFAIPLIYLSTVYGFGPLISCLDNGDTRYFTMSKDLVKGNLLKVFIIGIISSFIFSVPFYYLIFLRGDYRELVPSYRYAISIVQQICMIFINPFSTSVSISLLYKLMKKKCKTVM